MRIPCGHKAADRAMTCPKRFERVAVALYPAELWALLCVAYRRSCETDVIDTDFASPCYFTLFQSLCQHELD
jgi:hypothetical protein